jgi:hypothetical protein
MGECITIWPDEGRSKSPSTLTKTPPGGMEITQGGAHQESASRVN